ncbi:hypothetical protein AVEN_259173-1 [Araneus ventricosus]|uniref:Uncharacterized protein n=1 Tax=Araneus ventricosus TaxID=182803 RepID=A0A4Y1ZLK0_ARAVE|nr:hypothetical protein AVEN_43684-1 [Araneus ventricosus]GBL56066.1 hypothetical protein AVEN_259173-1 [Araneus ventricosus]
MFCALPQRIQSSRFIKASSATTFMESPGSSSQKTVVPFRSERSNPLPLFFFFSIPCSKTPRVGTKEGVLMDGSKVRGGNEMFEIQRGSSFLGDSNPAVLKMSNVLLLLIFGALVLFYIFFW